MRQYMYCIYVHTYIQYMCVLPGEGESSQFCSSWLLNSYSTVDVSTFDQRFGWEACWASVALWWGPTRCEMSCFIDHSYFHLYVHFSCVYIYIYVYFEYLPYTYIYIYYRDIYNKIYVLHICIYDTSIACIDSLSMVWYTVCCWCTYATPLGWNKHHIGGCWSTI